jgi:hypothetical protein
MLLSRHHNAGKSWHKDSWQKFWNSGTVQIFGKDYNKSKPHSGENLEEIDFG